MGAVLVSLLLLCQIAMAGGTVGCKLKWWTSVFPFVTVDFPVTTGVVMAVQRDLLITLITSGMDQFRSCFFGEPAPSLPGRRRNLYDPFPILHRTDLWFLKRYCVARNVLAHGSVGSNIVKCFGIIESEFPAGGAISGFKHHFGVLVNGGPVDAG